YTYSMKIVRLRAYQVHLPLHDVEVETDAGLVGYGEVCPLGRSICPRMPPACAPASPRWVQICSARSARTRQAQSADGCGAQGARLCQVPAARPPPRVCQLGGFCDANLDVGAADRQWKYLFNRATDFSFCECIDPLQCRPFRLR